jgi:integrase
VREFKISESEISYLTIDEIRTLLAECENSRSKDLTTVAKICLATGARLSEAEGLKGNEIRAGQIIYVKTKGKKTERCRQVISCRQRCRQTGKRNRFLRRATQPLVKLCRGRVSRLLRVN